MGPEAPFSGTKITRLTKSRNCLDLYEANLENFLDRFVTVNETGVNHFAPETKPQSRQWFRTGSPPPRQVKAILSTNKVMSSVIWDPKE